MLRLKFDSDRRMAKGMESNVLKTVPVKNPIANAAVRNW